MNVHLSRVSNNIKTGPIPVSTSSRQSCPSTCALKDNGCYASNFPMSLHWNAVSTGKRGDTYADFVDEISRLKDNQVWRHNQAGDLAGANDVIDAKALKQLVKANKDKRGFTYTHYPLTKENAKAIKHANKNGFTINMSAESLTQADELAALGIGPVVAIVPPGWNGTTTPAGRRVTVCPAQRIDHMTCAICTLCQKADRQAIVAFEAHGGRRHLVMQIAQLKLEGV